MLTKEAVPIKPNSEISPPEEESIINPSKITKKRKLE
jgi:hypothetical protein